MKPTHLEDGSLSEYQLFCIDMTKLTRAAVEELGLSTKEADRCRNFLAMGLIFWLYDRPLEPTLRYIEEKFGKRNPDVAEANRRALMAGRQLRRNHRGHRSTVSQVDKADLSPAGTYRNVIGNTALAWGLIAAAHLSGKRLFLGRLSDYAGQRHSARVDQAQAVRRAYLSGGR